MSSSLTDVYLQRARSLPAMPEVATLLLRSFERDDLGLNELAALIGRDLSLSACMANAFTNLPHFDRIQFWEGTLAVADGLRMTHPALVAHMGLDFEMLERQLPDHRLATSGAEELMH